MNSLPEELEVIALELLNTIARLVAANSETGKVGNLL